MTRVRMAGMSLLGVAVVFVAGNLAPAARQDSTIRVAKPSPNVAVLGSPASERIIAAVADRAPELLGRYIRIDTSNPPGNELAGARFLANTLRDEGIEARIFESERGRGNLLARLPGSGKKKPVILLSHIDVVPADPSQWSHPPYSGLIDGGSLYGRGALDAKGVGITELLALIALKRLGSPLDRDVIFLATADEEMGGKLGAGWMVEHHYDLFADAEFVLNEGGFIRRAEGRPLIYSLNAAEKGPCWFRVTARGEPGHASRPAAETAVTRLVAALAGLARWQRPYEVGPVVAGYYAAYAALDEEHARQFRQLARSLEDATFYKWFMSDPSAAALVEDTLVPTVLRGSNKTNIIPGQASAEIDSRLLPGHDCEDFLTRVRERVASDHVHIEPLIAFPSSQSPLANDLTDAVERLAAEESERSVVLPGLLAGFTDSHYFREKGIKAYGFIPLVVREEERETIHAPEERVEVEALKGAVQRMVRLLERLSE